MRRGWRIPHKTHDAKADAKYHKTQYEMIGFAFIHILKKNSSKCSWSHKHSAYRCCIPALTGLGGVHSQVSAAERRGGDSNPRWLSTIHDFQSCTFDHSDTSPDLPRTEREGFEPSVMQSTTPDFESGSFDHSDISPLVRD